MLLYILRLKHCPSGIVSAKGQEVLRTYRSSAQEAAGHVEYTWRIWPLQLCAEEFSPPSQMAYQRTRGQEARFEAPWLILRSFFAMRREDDFECDRVAWYGQADLATTSPDPLTVDDWYRKPIDMYNGMGIVQFPCVVNGRVEHDHSCRGCENIYTEYVCDELDERLLARSDSWPVSSQQDAIPRSTFREWRIASGPHLA